MRVKELLVIAVLGLSSLSVLAAEPTSYEWTRYDRESPTLYHPNELSLDLFGTYADRDRFGDKGDFWGGGLGVNYFFTRNIGIGADSYLEEWKWPYRVNGSLILRLPIDKLRLAPYGFGGGGREFKYATQWTGHAGGGLEFRFNHHAGIFGDGRRVFPDRTKDYTLVRFGVRLAF